MKRKFLILMAVLVFASVFFTSCETVEENADLRAMTESYLDAVIAGDEETATALLTTHANIEQAFFLLNGTAQYELKQIGWHTNITNGVKTTTTTYEMAADTGVFFTVKAYAREASDRLFDVEIIDTSWARRQAESTRGLNIALKVYTALVIAFGIWMLVDCIKRDIKNKILWIIVILLGVAFETLYGNSNTNVTFHLGLWLSASGVDVDVIEGTVQTIFALPVGCIVYFFCRKKLISNDKHANDR